MIKTPKLSDLKQQIENLQAQMQDMLPEISDSIDTELQEFATMIEQKYGIYVDRVRLLYAPSLKDWEEDNGNQQECTFDN